MGTDKNDLAEDRTHWAEDRTILANERTFAGWMRTGMACVAIALGLRAIFDDSDLWWSPARILSTILCATGVLIFLLARHKSCETLGRLRDHDAEPLPTRNVSLVAILLSAAATGTAVLLWVI